MPVGRGRRWPVGACVLFALGLGVPGVAVGLTLGRTTPVPLGATLDGVVLLVGATLVGVAAVLFGTLLLVALGQDPGT
jgi:hypothetical protein